MSTNESPQSRALGWAYRISIGAVCVAVAAIGGAGAYGTYTNASDLVGDGFAVSMVAGGEGVVAVCAMVMLLLTVLGRPAPAALRLGTVVMPVVASALGVVVADDLKTRVIMAAGPLAMTAASEGLCLIARNAVAAARGYDVEAVHREQRRAARLDEHAAKTGRLSKRIVVRTRRQLVASDPESAKLVRAALRKQVASDVSVRMAALGAVPADVDQDDNVPAIEQDRAALALVPAVTPDPRPATPAVTPTVDPLTPFGATSGNADESDGCEVVTPIAPKADPQANLKPKKQAMTDDELEEIGRQVWATLDKPVGQMAFKRAFRAAGHSAQSTRLEALHRKLKAEDVAADEIEQQSDQTAA